VNPIHVLLFSVAVVAVMFAGSILLSVFCVAQNVRGVRMMRRSSSRWPAGLDLSDADNAELAKMSHG